MGKQAHDTRLVAAMIAHEMTHILTFNTDDFKRFSEITAVGSKNYRTTSIISAHYRFMRSHSEQLCQICDRISDDGVDLGDRLWWALCVIALLLIVSNRNKDSTKWIQCGYTTTLKIFNISSNKCQRMYFSYCRDKYISLCSRFTLSSQKASQFTRTLGNF